MAAAQAGRYATLNGDGRTASHALDLATEVGVALTAEGVGDDAELPVGVLRWVIAAVTCTTASPIPAVRAGSPAMIR